MKYENDSRVAECAWALAFVMGMVLFLWMLARWGNA